MSENIRVLSVVDRYLEHARIFHFHAGGRREVYLSSADWMPRNFIRRVEVMFPIDDELLRDRVIDEILTIGRQDNTKARMLLPDGTYQRVQPENGDPLRRSQQRFIELARRSAVVEPARPEDSDEYVVPERQPPAKTTDSTVQPALHGKPSLLS
jgi:polyphosphate kinase